MRKLSFIFLFLVLFCTANIYAMDKLPNRMDKIKKGEWALYLKDGDEEVKVTILGVFHDDNSLKIRFEERDLDDGETDVEVESVYFEELLLSGNAIDMDDKFTTKQETVTVNGKSINATVISDGRTTVYFSPEIPFEGIIKVIKHNREIYKLLDYGFSSES